MAEHDPAELAFVPHEERFLDRFGRGDPATLKKQLVALAAFLRNKPLNTKRVYREAIRQFFTIFDWICPADATDRHAMAFKVWLKRRGVSDATAYHRVSTLRGYFAYLRTHGLVEQNPFDAVQRSDIKPPTEARVAVMEWARFERMLRMLPTDPAGLRDRAILLLFALTGCSRSAIAGLRVRDLDATSKPYKVNITTRGRRVDREIPRACYEAICAYWIAADRLRDMTPESGIFTAIAKTPLGGGSAPLSARMMNHILARAARRSGIPLGQVRINGIRHLAASAPRGVRTRDVDAFLRQLRSRSATLSTPPAAVTAKRFGTAAAALVARRDMGLRF